MKNFEPSFADRFHTNAKAKLALLKKVKEKGPKSWLARKPLESPKRNAWKPKLTLCVAFDERLVDAENTFPL